MTAALLFAFTATPQGRPIEMGARLYAGRDLVDQVGPALVRLPSAYVQDVDRKTAQRVGEYGRQLCTAWMYLADMMRAATDVVVWSEPEFEDLRALVHDMLGRPGEAKRGLPGKRIVSLQVGAAALLRGDRGEAWLPTLHEVRERRFGMVAQEAPGLRGVLDDLFTLRERLQDEGVLS
jgi:hypothetical protein